MGSGLWWLYPWWCTAHHPRTWIRTAHVLRLQGCARRHRPPSTKSRAVIEGTCMARPRAPVSRLLSCSHGRNYRLLGIMS